MAPRITVDQDECSGYGNCVFVAPEVFDLDDDNFARVLVDRVDGALRDAVQLAVDECPMRAISFDEGR